MVAVSFMSFTPFLIQQQAQYESVVLHVLIFVHIIVP